MKKTITTYFKNIFVLALFLFVSMQSNATHITGGNIEYICLGNNQYEVSLTVFRDCNGIGLWNTTNLSFTSNTCIDFTTIAHLDPNYPVFSTPVCPTATQACNSSTVYGIERYVYRDTVTLASCDDWVIAWSICCRSPNITTLYNPSGEVFYIETELDATISSCDNSPSFINKMPDIYVCGVNSLIQINCAATDTDGDSLVYSLIDALNSPTSIVSYYSPLSGISPIIATTVNLNSSTGILSFMPTTVQRVVFVIQVEEYRNGVKIGAVVREFSTVIGTCTNNNTSPVVNSINGTTINNGNIPISVFPNTPISLNIGVFDPDTSQILITNWSNVPTNATVVGGASPAFNWTPTLSDSGIYNVYLTIMDDNCPIVSTITYALQITVAGVNQRPIAVDDYYTTKSNEIITRDILSNDTDPDGNNLTWTNIIVPPATGSILSMTNNQLIYTSGFNYVGLDSFVYEICDDGSPVLCTQASVYINVDYQNYNISDTVAVGTTADLCFTTTNLIGNLASVTIQSDSFSNATILNVDLATGCFQLKADSIAVDDISIIICDNSGGCITNTITLNVERGVWPGDTDTNQTVNNFDLLNIGLGFGNTGAPRNPASIAWNGYLTPDWTKVMPVSNINFKHIDCNGDGIVDMQDTVAISNNWNLSYTYNKSGAGVIPLYVDTISTVIKRPTLPIMLGTQSIPADDIYGIAFTISYDTSLIRENTIDIGIDTSWLGTAWTDLIKVHKDFYNDGMVQVAITRTDGVDFDGFGRIGSLSFTIQDDIMQRGALIFPFEIMNVKAIDQNEMEILTNPLKTELSVIATNTNQLHLDKFINVFPNPVEWCFKYPKRRFDD